MSKFKLFWFIKVFVMYYIYSNIRVIPTYRVYWLYDTYAWHAVYDSPMSAIGGWGRSLESECMQYACMYSLVIYLIRFCTHLCLPPLPLWWGGGIWLEGEVDVLLYTNTLNKCIDLIWLCTHLCLPPLPLRVGCIWPWRRSGCAPVHKYVK